MATLVQSLRRTILALTLNLLASALTAQPPGGPFGPPPGWSPYEPIACGTGAEVVVNATKNPQTGAWTRPWIPFQKQVVPDPCSMLPMPWIGLNLFVRGEMRVALPVPTAGTAQLMSGIGRVRIDASVPLTSLSQLRPTAIQLNFTHVGGEFAAEWRNVEVKLNADLPLTGVESLAREFVPPAAGDAWGTDGTNSSPDPTIGPDGQVEMRFSRRQAEVLDGVDFAVEQAGTFVMSDDRTALLGPGIGRIGLTADGASRLLLRYRAAEPGVFSVAVFGQTDPKDVRLGPAGGSLATGPVAVATRQVTATQHWLFLEIEAPPDFDRLDPMLNGSDRMQKSRAFTLRLDFAPTLVGQTPTTADISVQLHRTPVLLVHGLWGDKEGWTGYVNGLGMTSFEVQAADYGPTSLGGSTNGAALNVNAVRMRKELEQIRQERRSAGIAIARIDWVAHSMGGCIARELYRIGQQALGIDRWARADNFGAGDVRKLITITTPHFGSRFANILRRDSIGSAGIRRLIEATGNQVGDAIRDLSIGSAAIAGFGITDIHSHTIVGTGCETLFPLVGSSFSFALAAFQLRNRDQDMAKLFSLLTLLNYTPAQVYGTEAHDGIVVASSQQANAPASTNLTVLSPTLTHTTVRNVQEFPHVYQRVVELLHAELDGSDFAPLPQPPVQAAPQLPLTATLPPIGLPISITLPVTVGACIPLPWGQPVTIVLQPQLGFAPTDVVLLGNGFVVPMFPQGNGTWAISITLPNLELGQQDVIALGVDATGQVSRSEFLCIEVQPSLPLVSLQIEPNTIEMNVPLMEQPVRVKASTLFGLSFDVTRAATITSSQPHVARVEGRGRLLGLRTGTTTLQASFLGLSATASVSFQLPEQVMYRQGGPGAGGVIPQLLSQGGAPTIGNASYALRAEQVVGGTVGLWAMSLAPDKIEIGDLTLFVDPLQAATGAALVTGPVGQPGAGTATLPFAIPNSASLVGIELFTQALFLDAAAAGALSFTNGFAFRVL